VPSPAAGDDALQLPALQQQQAAQQAGGGLGAYVMPGAPMVPLMSPAGQVLPGGMVGAFASPQGPSLGPPSPMPMPGGVLAASVPSAQQPF
jgi:hypothetical protein